MNKNLEQSTLAGGCFWCTEAVFQNLKGVQSITSGYSGGTASTAHYQMVCTGQTDHAECVHISFDPEVIDHETVLKVHLTTHDPTSLNQQGADTGPQYRSAIFYHDDAQKQTAQTVINELQAALKKPIVTTLEPFVAFYPAENTHHNFYQQNRQHGYCQVVIEPKLAKLRQAWEGYLEK